MSPGVRRGPGARSQGGAVIRVRGHMRGLRGVREHFRSQPNFTVRLLREGDRPEDRKIAADLMMANMHPRAVTATVDLRRAPREIVLVNAPDIDPDDLARVLSHETLHSVLHTEHVDREPLNPRSSTLLLDQRWSPTENRSPAAKHRLTREGLYRYRPGPYSRVIPVPVED